MEGETEDGAVDQEAEEEADEEAGETYGIYHVQQMEIRMYVSGERGVVGTDGRTTEGQMIHQLCTQITGSL